MAYKPMSLKQAREFHKQVTRVSLKKLKVVKRFPMKRDETTESEGN